MYTVKQVSKRMDISQHTIRYYSNLGLFPYITRDENNSRLFSDDDLVWVYMVRCLRDVGMSISDIKHYVDLCIEGDSTIPERFLIVQRQREEAKRELIEAEKRLSLLDWKCNYYEDLLNGKEPDTCNPIVKAALNKEKVESQDQLENEANEIITVAALKVE